MTRRIGKILAGMVLLAGSGLAQAGVINYDLPNVSNSTSTDAVVNWFSTSVIADEIASFTLNIRWRDQGWGNRKGRIVYRSGDSGWQDLGLLAGHFWSNQSRTINSISPDDFDVAPLEFGYVVGGGGGHRLYIRNANLTVNTVPEPSTIALAGLGLLGLVAVRRRRTTVG